MTRITREPASAARERYDVAILGAGIYGTMLLLIAAGHGLKALLLERDDFGGGTSFNSLRIIHGGLRYLQSLDFARSRAMIKERAWFLESYPDLTVELPCLLPLYNRGLQRRLTLAPALWVDYLLSKDVHNRLPHDRRLRAGHLVSRAEVRRLAPMVRPATLKGGAIWYDAHIPDTERLIMETLRWATSMGASALNYVEARELLRSNGRVHGVVGHDRSNGQEIEFRADVVINATGPRCRRVAAEYDRDVPEIFRPSLAWNILFERAPLSDHAVAVSELERGARTFFLLPWKGKLLAGTGHRGVVAERDAEPTRDDVAGMIDDINRAVPGAGLTIGDVAHVFSGLLPVRREGTVDLATREVIRDHGASGGPEGLFTVSGVKLVAAHQVARKTIRQVCDRFFSGRPRAPSELQARPAPATESEIRAPTDGSVVDASSRSGTSLRQIIDEESVVHLDDLVYRRTTLWETPSATARAAPELCSLFPWDETTRSAEIARLRSLLQEDLAWRSDSAGR